jgi:hypothetical protein
MAHESLRSFWSQLLAVVLAGLTLNASAVDTSMLSNLPRPAKSAITYQTNEHNKAAKTNDALHWNDVYAVTSTEATTIADRADLMANDSTLTIALNNYLAKNKTFLEGYHPTDTTVQAWRSYAYSTFGWHPDEGTFSSWIRNVDSKALTDNAIANGMHVRLHTAANAFRNLASTLAQLEKENNGKPITWAQVRMRMNPPFATILTLPTMANFILPATCGRWRTGFDVVGFVGWGISVWGGFVAPYAWVGDAMMGIALAGFVGLDIMGC